MAAQPLVLRSYENPRETFDVNVIGTVNVLDIAFKRDFVKAIIIVTTDKVYKNDNSGRAFVETDPLEGKDPYSSSKVATEAVVTAWQQIAKISGGPRVASVRAGNVIGGGDFAENRIIPDIIRGALTGNPVMIRNPESTRPWQHVLDPLTGYLLLLECAFSKHEMSNLNFGPKGRNLTVKEIAQFAKLYFSELIMNFEDLCPPQTKESISLNLNSDASSRHLNWRPVFSQEQSAKMAFNWWKKLMNNESSVQELCLDDIETCLKSRI
jgi:CDP-glucose 4,6-dehydratase